MAGKKVDPEGDIVDRMGNVLGHAERWEEADPEAEKEIDRSQLAGKRVNKAGKLVDEHGSIYGVVVEGDPAALVGKVSDRNGQIWDDGGNIVGRAELLPETERGGQKEGPFASFLPCKVQKDGTVLGSDGKVRGKLIEGDATALENHDVDKDGDVVDSNGNAVGKAQRYEPEEQEKEDHPCKGFKVNGEGNVVDGKGDLIGKLTAGEIAQCHGKEVDGDGDVVDSKGTTVGHVTPLADLGPEGLTEQELALQQQQQEALATAEKDKKLCLRMCTTLDDTLDKVQPLLKQMVEVCMNSTPNYNMPANLISSASTKKSRRKRASATKTSLSKKCSHSSSKPVPSCKTATRRSAIWTPTGAWPAKPRTRRLLAKPHPRSTVSPRASRRYPPMSSPQSTSARRSSRACPRPRRR